MITLFIYQKKNLVKKEVFSFVKKVKINRSAVIEEKMTTDENLLEAMLERVTNSASDDVDNLAIQMFCIVVQSNSGLVTKAHELIIKKIYSSNITEAARAIGLLEECMSKGGLEFQKKTAKFTFLNELIALVLDKHSGTPAPIETKKRILECLMLWTVEHQDKLKIQETYDNLKRQVDFSHSPLSVNPKECQQRSSILGNDDELVAKLLKQGGEENLKQANLLIKRRFNEESRRTEFICHLKSELTKIESTMELLDEMLNSYSSDTTDVDSCDTIQELYNTCKGHNEQMARWPDFLGNGEPNFLEKVLNTKELLVNIIHRYKERFTNEVACTKLENITLSTTPVAKPTTTNTDLLSDLLGDTLTTSIEDSKKTFATNPIKVNDNATMEDLSDIFGSISGSSEVNKKSNSPTNLFGKLDLLEPISVFQSPTKDDSFNMPKINGKDEKKKQSFKELKEIDKLSEEMFMQSLKEEQRLQSFKKETEKITLNDLVKDKIQTSLYASKEEDSNIPIRNKQNANLTSSKLPFNVDLQDLKEIENKFKTSDIKELPKKTEHTVVGPLKPLSEISVDLDELTPLDEGQRLLLDDDDIKVTLNFTADRPCDHVSIIVMAVTNKSKLPVKDFQFEASVKKPCKVRLLPPTDETMAPSKPFRLSTPINQIVLLFNPTQKSVDLTCIIGYKIGDDPDPIKESIVAKSIPSV